MIDYENDSKSHQNEISYWVFSEWFWYVPYAKDITRVERFKWSIKGGAGETIVDLDIAEHILFYGANNTGSLPIEFLSECAEKAVGITIHSHGAEPLVMFLWNASDRNDLLTNQIIARQNEKTRAYIARTLVKWQWKQREWLGPCTSNFEELASTKLSSQVMTLQTQSDRNYWEVYYRNLNLETTRSSGHPVNIALDALMQILFGITLTWVNSHSLSPAHGFLHSDTNYPSLVYDLTEVNRWWTEKAVFDTYREFGEDRLVERSIHKFNDMLNEQIHSEPTRQIVYRKSLIHGGVIALQHFLDGRMQRFLPPVEEDPKQRGRKRTTSYKLTGQIWKK